MTAAELLEKGSISPSSRIWTRLADFREIELTGQRAQAFLWVPVFLAVGIGFYFSLYHEPPVFSGAVAFLFMFSLFLLLRDRPIPKVICAGLLLVTLGFLAAQVRTHLVYTPIIQKELGPLTIEGTIHEIEDMGEGEGSRIVLSRIKAERLGPKDTPALVRLRVRKDDALRVGQRIQALAQLHPPSPPVMPGGFDFQRYMYFQKIGAVGFIYTQPEILQDLSPGTLNGFVQTARQGIARITGQYLPHPQAAVAMALMNGQRGAIPESDVEAMRDAGLAHMLAISGLHVGLFSGVVFFLVRLMMAAVPGLVLRHPIKKYAAVVAFMAACIYMLLAGATIPTQRALFMTGVVFLAILLDRSPISLRLVAFAAFVVLLTSPESLLSASFHMSFGAVAALIVFYEWLRPWWSRWHRQAGVMRRAALYFLGVSFTTLVASVATAPFALFHFQQLALYSLLGNFIAMPLLAFIIMPMAAIAFLLIPFGLSFLPLKIMGWGISGMLETAHWVAELPHSTLHVGAWPQSALMFFVMGALFLMLWRGRLRVFGLLPICVSVFIIFLYKQPDIIISSGFDLVGVRNKNVGLMVSNLRRERFARENWERAFGLEEGAAQKWPNEGEKDGMTCGEMGCRMEIEGHKISYLKNPAIFDIECAWANIILSPEPLDGQYCRGKLVIDYFDAWREGSQALRFEKGKIIHHTAQDYRGLRPWTK